MSKETNKTNDYKRNVPVWEEIKRKVMGRNVTNVYENKKMNFYRNKRNELLWEQKKIIVMRKNEANVYGNK